MDEAINLSDDEGEEEVGSVPNKAEVPSGSKASKAAKATKMKAKKLKPNLSGNPVKRQRKLTSPVWKHFEMIDELDENGNIQCKCKKCGTKYIAKSSHGTGNMLRHARSCNTNNYADVGQLLIKTITNGSFGTRSAM
ncbi:unnamed protein product [Lactuca virosa]|uniref:BED-type domain-containing protein n=1 Tax=Lactuca virosa TaxID=75947 RepID=A0AAU9L8R1_9ASTR|nr:unnamed protein product [Lactuca virosa]